MNALPESAPPQSTSPGPAAPAGDRSVEVVGVVGCGLMGSGIAELAARSGFHVVVREISQDILHAGLGRIRSSLDRALQRGKLTDDEHALALDRIRGTTELSDLGGCDLIIEAALEDLSAKREIFASLDEVAPRDALLASNTSSISITKLAAATSRPERVIGMHFFNPVPVMPLLEIVRGLLTSDASFAEARRFGERVGKTVVVCLKDSPGFIVNLLFVPYGLDAIRGLEQGVATKEDFDTAMRLGMNHPMGPFELMDFVGLDTMLFIADAMFEDTRDPRYAAPPLLRRLVAAGRLGKKAGAGFYTYDRPPAA